MSPRMEKRSVRTAKRVLVMACLVLAIAMLFLGGAVDGGKKGGGGGGSENGKGPVDVTADAQKSGGFFGQLGKDVTRKVARDTIAEWIQDIIPHPVLLGLVLVGLAVGAAYFIWKFCKNRRQSETGSSEEAEGLTSVVASGGQDANGVADPPIQAQGDHSENSDTPVIQTPDNETDNDTQKTPSKAA